jgi:hypothetical protein
MLQCDEDNQPFDESTLVASLEQSGKLDALGGIAYVSGLTDGAVEDPRLVSRHAQTVSRLSQLRRLRTLGERISDAACVRDADPALVLKSALTEIEGLENGCDLDGNLTPVEGLRSTRKADIATLATIEAKEVNWLWKPYLPAGMLAMLSGDPGTGKTFIALAVAADVTAGRVPCTNERSEPADVLYLSVENSPEHVLRPRFDSLGGNPNRFHILRGSVNGSGSKPAKGSVWLSDIPLLDDALGRTTAKLVIVDPIQSYLGAEVDAHRSNETRPVMDGLSRLCQDRCCCVLLVRHLSKAQSGRAIHRGLGSIDLTGAVRSELVAGSSPDDPANRALAHLKSNLGQLGPSHGYAIDTDGKFRWTGESQLSASVLLAPEQNVEPGALVEAKEFLRSELADGPEPADGLKRLAARQGISNSTLRRAKDALRIHSSKSGMDGGWAWSLSEDAQDRPKMLKQNA